MFELMLCSMFTLVPDYLYRRYGQGKRIGKEITLFSMWYELRWGIIGCVMLTVLLITTIFYFHPSTIIGGAVLQDRADRSGRLGARRRGQGRLQRSRSRRATCCSRSTARSSRPRSKPPRRKIAEVDAAARRRQGRRGQGRGPDPAGQQRLQAGQGRTRREERVCSGAIPGIVPQRDIEKLQVLVDGRQAAIDAATAAKQSAEVQVSTLLPAAKASAEAALAQAQVDLDKTVVRAGVDGRVEQFLLAARRRRQSADAARRHPDPGRRGPARAAGRLRSDRGAGAEARHDRRGRVHVTAVDDHPDGHHQRAGLHRRRPVPRRRAACRCEQRRDPARSWCFWSRSRRTALPM